MRAARYHKKHSSTNGKPPVQALNPHSLPSPRYLNTSEYSLIGLTDTRRFLQVATIDPGSSQCGFRIEREWSDGQITTVAMHCLDFTKHLNGSSPTPEEDTPFFQYHNIVRFIEYFKPLFITCQYIGIESQMEFASPNVRLEQTFITAFLSLMKDQGCRPIILVLDSALKTTGLGAPSKFPGIKQDGTNPPKGRANRVKIERKKWCRVKALQMLVAREDNEYAKMIDNLALDKSYDICDCVCYGEVVRLLLRSSMYRIPIPEVIEPKPAIIISTCLTGPKIIIGPQK